MFFNCSDVTGARLRVHDVAAGADQVNEVQRHSCLLQRRHQRERHHRSQVRQQWPSGEEQHRQFQDSFRISSQVQEARSADASSTAKWNSRNQT